MRALQNGSDIRGIAISTENNQANLTENEAEKIAKGLVKWLQVDKELQGPLTIGIGHDSRLSADTLKQGLIKGLLTQGVHIIDVGLSTTPAMFMATQFEDYQCDASIMITASHLPYYYNGIKLFTKQGGAEHEDIEQILTYSMETIPSASSEGSVETRELIPRYAQDLVEKIRQGIGSGDTPLTGFHIVVDAGNGAGGFFAKEVLEELGANTTGSQFLEPDGHFPNHIPNPDNKEAMASIRQAVLDQQADLGVIFDTDVDRAAVVDQTGQSINRNNLIAVLAQIVLTEYPGSTIVTNSPTSSHLKTFIESLGGKQVRYLCGYRNVINKGIELNQKGIPTELSIETSGHAAFKENYFLDDGAYVIAKILMLLPKLREEGKTLGDLIATLKQPAEAKEVRFNIVTDNYREEGEKVIEELASFVNATDDFVIDPENEEGIRVNFTGDYGMGWFLLRMSLHEPLLVLQVENDEANKNQLVFQKLATFFESYDFLNTDKLTEVLTSI